MNIIIPVAMTDAVLTASNIVENDETEWSSITAYPEGSRVMRTIDGTHSIYIALQSTTGDQPEDDDLQNPVYWARESATNRWAMFSDQINDQTEQSEFIEIELTSGSIINSLAMFNLVAASVEITVTSVSAGIVFNQEYTMVDNAGIDNIYDWHFEPIVLQKTLAVIDLPPYSDTTVKIKIIKEGDIAKCGLITFGYLKNLGITNNGTTIGTTDYSRKVRDTFGNPIIIKRNNAKRANYKITVPTGSVEVVQNTLDELLTIPVAWIGSIDFPSTVVYGLYDDFDIDMQPTVSDFTLQVNGLT